MKTIKLLSVATIFFITAMMLTSCGITKNNDFSSQKYTNFKKGKTTVNMNQVLKENKDADLFAAVTDQKKVAEVATIIADKTSQSTINSKPEIKKESGKTGTQFNSILKETNKEKLNRATSFVKDRLTNKPNTASHNDDGLSVFWVVILILLIIWAIGLASGGFGLGGLINILLVIALILLILWLLEVV